VSGSRSLQRLVVLFVLAATLPAPGSLGGERASLGVPLDSSLRVPLTAALLGSGPGALGLEGRLLGFASVPSQGWREPRNRSELVEWLNGYGGDQLDVVFAGRRGSERARLSVERTTGLRKVIRDAPTFLAGLLLLALGFVLSTRPAHAAVWPLFAVCCAAGAMLLAQLDGILPDTPALLPLPGVRARVGALAFVLLPATLTHLAAQFPGPVTRWAGAAFLPYLGWGLAAAFAQVHLGDAALRNALDRMATGAGVAALCLVVIGVLATPRAFRPIERGRAGALVAALITTAALVGAGLWRATSLNDGLAGPLLLAVVAFPFSIAFSILHYGLAAPPPWFSRWAAVFRPVARRRYERERAARVALDDLASAVAGAPDPAGVRRALADGVTKWLAPEACVVWDFIASDSLSPPLARDGVLLWRAAMAPRSPVRVTSRLLDPGVDRAELVVPILPRCGRRLLVVMSGRQDGLPWAREQEALLESFVPVVATALDAVAKRSELTRRVLEKTDSLERAIADRERLLLAAREIGEANDRRGVRAVLARIGEVGSAGTDREGELRPQLETASAFAAIALERLRLLEDLRSEVDRQASELTEVRSRRLHAEFVRGVAHELRKPLDEVRRRIEAARSLSPMAARRDLDGANRAGVELARRLDLLLCHSGLRLDRQRVDLSALARAALASAADAAPDRTFLLECESSRVPLMGDPCRLGSVLENLLDNAVKATVPGQRITLRVGLESQSCGGSNVFLEVEDPGCGVPAGRLEDVFSPGVSLAPGGFGLGLTLCRQIVRLHGGTLRAAGERGATVFRAVLPQRAGMGVEAETEEGAEDAA